MRPLAPAAISPDFGATLSNRDFEARFVALHRQLFASTEFTFAEVTQHVFAPPAGRYQVDHSLIHDGKNWHLFYCTGDLRLEEEWIRCCHEGDWEGANRCCVEPGNGHAVGPDLFSLVLKQEICFPAQGRFDLASRGVCSVFRHGQRYGMLYDVRGERDGQAFTGMSLAWSDDLERWELERTNPVLGPPAWARPDSTCKDPHIMQVDGVYLVYYIVMDRAGYCSVALVSTTDWRSFHDEGCVFRSAPLLRGTLGIESPCVVHRNGIWHLFFTYGPGVWHAISPRPTAFVHGRPGEWNVGTGFYCLGPFHATEVVEHNGDWWLTSDRKEETRRLNRVAGRLCYRGSYEDEKTLEEGIYLARLRWDGDQPVFERPT